MAGESDNSDRLRGLHRPSTPEERPAGRQGQHTSPTDSSWSTSPGAASSNAAPSASSHSTTPRKPWLPTVLAVLVVGALIIGSLLIALAVRDTGSQSVADDEFDSGPPSNVEADVESREPPPLNATNAFDRPTDVSGLIDKVTDSTVVIVCESDEAFGSGFVLDLALLTGDPDRVIVTNHHVVVGCLDSQRVDVYQSDDAYVGEILAWDRATDVAVMRVPALSAPALEPNVEPVIGQWVMAVGAPEGVENSASFGFITNILTDEPTLTSDAVIAGGSSGGPLVDNQGRVLAVNYAVWEEATGISLSAPIGSLCIRTVDCD